MSKMDASKQAGLVLRRLIQENYPSQEEFAYEFGADIRTISRYVNQGINKVNVLQELADFFQIELWDFFRETEE